MATKTIRAKKNPVAEKERLFTVEEAAKEQNLPVDIYKELLDYDRKEGNFLLVDRKNYEVIQTDNLVEGFADASRNYGSFALLDLNFPDGVYRESLGFTKWEFE